MQQIKDLALSLKWLGLLLWRSFYPRHGNFCNCGQKKKKKFKNISLWKPYKAI